MYIVYLMLIFDVMAYYIYITHLIPIITPVTVVVNTFPNINRVDIATQNHWIYLKNVWFF